MSNPTELDEFPYNNKVNSWEDSIVQLYSAVDPARGPVSRARMPLLKVLELRLYKAKLSPEHEYIVAKISRPQQPDGLLRIERFADRDINGKADGDTLQSFQSTSSLASSPNTSASSQLSSKVDALDTVSTMRNGEWPSENHDVLIEKAVCKRDCPAILLHLAILAKIVHDDSPIYRTFSRQCYWYADTIMRVFQSSFSGITSERCEESGKWNRIPIYDPEATKNLEDIVCEIKRAFKQRQDYVDKLVRIVDQLCRHYTGAHNGQYRSKKAKPILIIT